MTRPSDLHECASCTRSPDNSEKECVPVAEQVKTYRIRLCGMCVSGEGGECHVPGCALFLNRAPDVSLQDNPMVEEVLDEL